LAVAETIPTSIAHQSEPCDNAAILALI
jgi:hypothetical protein